jgi:maltooligosyltrehalose trehalohydrolase
MCTFRVWAPRARSVAVRTDRAQPTLEAAAGGMFHGRGAAEAGDRYEFILDDREQRPDPCSRGQPDGLRGRSRILDLAALTEGLQRRPVALAELVVYELHVGTFSQAGTFESVIPRLAQLRELGITAIQLMPVATFAGTHGWGYDGVYSYAPHCAYGGPQGLARLVAAAHDNDLAVFMDVVYNHLGAGSDAVEAVGPYTTSGEETVWGGAMNFAELGVREWAIQNAEMWARDYRIDGLRLDAVHAIADDSEEHVMAELARRVKAIDPAALILPTKIRTAFLDPIHLDSNPDRANDDEYVQAKYDEVRASIQTGMDALARRRRFPLFG